MSDLVFPSLDGIEMNTVKRPEFKTQVFEALSGNESRAKMRKYPKYTFKLSFEFLVQDKDEAQLKALMGFMLQLGGMYESFLYADPDDSYVTKQSIGTGNGVATDFQIVRNYGGFVEPLHIVKSVDALEVDGVLMVQPADWTRTVMGLITFTTPPANGAVITWTGSYYYRVRFLADGYDFTKFMKDLHECKDIEFIGSVRKIV
jgi:uncharacterized protein (TIGR02217 family)